jgi:hypothetical protein
LGGTLVRFRDLITTARAFSIRGSKLHLLRIRKVDILFGFSGERKLHEKSSICNYQLFCGISAINSILPHPDKQKINLPLENFFVERVPPIVISQMVLDHLKSSTYQKSSMDH